MGKLLMHQGGGFPKAHVKIMQGPTLLTSCHQLICLYGSTRGFHWMSHWAHSIVFAQTCITMHFRIKSRIGKTWNFTACKAAECFLLDVWHFKTRLKKNYHTLCSPESWRKKLVIIKDKQVKKIFYKLVAMTFFFFLFFFLMFSSVQASIIHIIHY